MTRGSSQLERCDPLMFWLAAVGTAGMCRRYENHEHQGRGRACKCGRRGLVCYAASAVVDLSHHV